MDAKFLEFINHKPARDSTGKSFRLSKQMQCSNVFFLTLAGSGHFTGLV